jgi:hypothetical protein
MCQGREAMSNNSAQSIIRECDDILNGKITGKTPEQLQRWLTVQVKKLALRVWALENPGVKHPGVKHFDCTHSE